MSEINVKKGGKLTRLHVYTQLSWRTKDYVIIISDITGGENKISKKRRS